jgi:hypothetical protein
MEIEPNLTIGEVCPDASPMRHAETGDAPSPRECKVYNLQRSEFRKARKDRGPSVYDKPADVLHVRGYSRPNWFTSSGVLRKRREIEAKGMPSMKNWRFLTTTVDPEQFGHDPLAAYLWIVPRLRHFVKLMKDHGLMHDDGAWGRKLEFQENGWPHWHWVYDVTRKYTEAELAKIGELWGFGRTNVERVREDEFLYSFKYAFKPVQVIEDADLFDYEPAVAPAWFLDYQGVDKTGRLVSFAKTRFWQTSGNFYTAAKPAKPAEKKERKPPQDSPPARERANLLQTTVQVVARKPCGKYIASAVIALTCATGLLWRSVAWDVLHGQAVGLAVNNYVVPTSTIEKHASPSCPKLQHLKSVTRLSLAKARRLASDRNTLATC